MSDEFEGTPSLEAPESDVSEDFSPSVDDGTPVSDPDSGRGTDEAAALRAEVEELRKRVAGQTRSWQEADAARKRLEQRIESWKRAGLDPDEIDRAVMAASQQLQQNYSQQQTSQVPRDVVTRGEMNTLFNIQKAVQTWEFEKEKYFDKNPADDTPQLRQYLDNCAYLIAEQERRELGQIVSTPKDIARKAFAELQKFKNHMASQLQKNLTQTREKVKGQSVVDTKHTKPKPAESGEEPPMTDSEYAELFRSHSAKIKNKR